MVASHPTRLAGVQPRADEAKRLHRFWRADDLSGDDDVANVLPVAERLGPLRGA